MFFVTSFAYVGVVICFRDGGSHLRLTTIDGAETMQYDHDDLVCEL